MSVKVAADRESAVLMGAEGDLLPEAVIESARATTIYEMLARMPFIDRLELSYLYGVTPTTCHRYLDLMERSGVVGWFDYETRHLRSSRRYYLTQQGLELVRMLNGEALRDRYPVSRIWRRSLSQRLDAIASIYRLAASMATETGMAPIFVRLCIRGPWDAFIEFPDGVIIGVLRQGVAMSRHAMSDRFWRMSRREDGPPPLTLVMAADDMERREAVKRLANYPDLSAVAVCEFDVLDAERTGESWELPNHLGGMFSMPEFIGDIERAKGSDQDFSEYWVWSTRDAGASFSATGGAGSSGVVNLNVLGYARNPEVGRYLEDAMLRDIGEIRNRAKADPESFRNRIVASLCRHYDYCPLWARQAYDMVMSVGSFYKRPMFGFIGSGFEVIDDA